MAAKAKSKSFPASSSSGPIVGQLLQEEEVNVGSAAPRRKLTKRNTDQQVTKKYWDHFRDFDDNQKYIIVVEGMTLEERLTKDTRASRGKNGIPMGAPYYRSLRLKYSSVSSNMAQLAAKDSSEEVRPAFRAAYKLFKSRPKERTPLIELLKTLSYHNNKETVGLAKALFEEDVSKGAEARDLVVSISRWFARNDIANVEPDVFRNVKAHIDSSISVVYRDLKKEGVKLTAFWSVYSDVCSLVVSKDDVETLLSADSSWLEHAETLSLVVGSSKIGAAMWGWVQAKVVDVQARDLMVKFSEQLTNLAKLTSESVEEPCTKLRQAVGKIDGISLLPLRRTCIINYRGTDCEHVVSGIEDELQRRLSAEAKARAAATGKLQLLLFEEDLVGDYMGASTHVDMNLIQGCQEARTAANQFCLLEYDSPSGCEYIKVLMMKQKSLAALDRSFTVELSWISAMASGPGVKMLMTKVLTCLPSKKVAMTAEDSLGRLATLFGSPLYSFTSKSAQAEAGFIRQAVTAINLRRRPSALDSSATQTLQDAYQQLAYFCTAGTLAKDGVPGSLLRGKAAVDHLFEECDQKAKAGVELTMNDMAFGQFFFLLSDTQSVKLKEWCNKLLPSWDGDARSADDGDKQIVQLRKKAKLAECEIDKSVDDAFA
ncbi:unnamed protein product [Polarella glacialis]|uniref:Uncharacterized protein n=2 Tax=Polarella glacialis TaxID=89957 RepID=A0A813DC26_POLGL|nr:unnamed protein product [Polarella glacialis]